MFDAKPEDRSMLAVVPFKFWTDHVEVNGKLEAVDFASWGKKGYANWEQSEKVSRLQRDAVKAAERPDPMPSVWDALQPHYERWKKGQEAMTEGYALEGWAGGITKGQIAACKALHIHSVEDLAKAPDDVVQKLGMGAPKLREAARAFTASLNGEGAKIAKENAELKAELQQLRAEQEADRAAMREFMAKHGMQAPEMPADAAGEQAAPKPAPRKKAA